MGTSRELGASTGEESRRKVRGPLHFRLHHWLGLLFGSFAGFVCLTGSIAVLSHEIQWLASPMTRASAGEAETTPGERWDAARAAFPDVTFHSLTLVPTESGVESYFATRADGTDPFGNSLSVYVDPASGEVRGMRRGVSFPSFMRALHYYLFDVTGAGFYVVGILGPILLVMMITGLRTYRGWRRGFSRLPARTQSRRLWTGALHRLLGVWSLLFLPIIGVTVVWYLLEWDGLLKWADGEVTTRAGSLHDLRSIDGADLDRWIDLADRELPGLRLTSVYLPWTSGDAVYVSGQWRARLVRERANSVSIDPVSDRVLSVSKADEMGWRERWTHTADPLHFGGFGGLATKLIWFIAGLALTALCFSGVSVYAARMGNARKA